MVKNSSQSVIMVDDGRCIGSGNCVETADDYFDQSDDDGTVIVLKDFVESADENRIERAVSICPVLALRLEKPAAER